jgi:hypothetical protein
VPETSHARESGVASTPYTQRVKVGAYYTDGITLYEVVGVNPLGSVDVRDVYLGRCRTLGIDAFRRSVWLARGSEPTS